MLKKNVLKGLFTILCAGGFAVIAYFVTQDTNFAFDRAVQEAVFSHRSDFITNLMIPLTYSGNWQAVTAVCAALLLLPSTRRQYGFPLTLSAVSSVSIYELLKFIFQRPRPEAAVRLISQTGFSFPSGHSLSSLVVWGTLILLIRFYSQVPRNVWEENGGAFRILKPSAVRLSTAVLTAYIILIGLSRIYVGVHYPTDVLASWCLGGCILTVIHSSLLRAVTSGMRP